MTAPSPLPLSQSRFWLLFIALVAGLLWLLKPILLPFVAGLVLAYFLDPAVDRLAAWRVPRWLGTLLVLLGFIFIVVFVFLLLAPLIKNQTLALMSVLPETIETLKTRLLPQAEAWAHKLSPHDVEKLRDAASAYAGSAIGWAGDLLRNIISRGFALFDILTLAVITPIVAFYLLRDWPKVTETVQELVPRTQKTYVGQAMEQINNALSGFIRGQALVCLALGFIYSVGLTLAGLNYGASVGIIAGFLSFIPYVGSTFGLVVSMLLAFIQFDQWSNILAVLAVFLFGQAMEGYVLTPKLVGDRVGLHPVWILFALFAGGSLLGFVGILIAVPVAAVIGVLVRLGIKGYKGSSFYKAKNHQ